MRRGDQEIVPVRHGTLLRMFPERQGRDVFPKRITWLGKAIPFVGNPVFEVESYIFDRDGGHVTFNRGGEGTFVVFGGGRIESVKFPYPHPMFEVIDEAEATQIRLQWQTDDLIKLATSRWWRWPNGLWWSTSRFEYD